MQEVRSTAQEAAEDVFFGQVVINWARWFIIAAGVVLVLLTFNDPNKIVIGILPIVGLMAMNFYLHGRRMAERPANRALIALSSVVDLVAITAVVLIWPDGDAQGLKSPFFIMYYPVVLAFAFVLPPRVTIAYTVFAMAAYAGACLLADPFVFGNLEDIEALIARLITLGAMGALGTYYWRIQRDRRRAASVDTADAGIFPAVSR